MSPLGPREPLGLGPEQVAIIVIRQSCVSPFQLVVCIVLCLNLIGEPWFGIHWNLDDSMLLLSCL
jgi:hypothetical protein